jgi:hypothetical protein
MACRGFAAGLSCRPSEKGALMPRNLAQAREELEKLVFLEAVAERREEQIRRYLRHLVSNFNFDPAQLAKRLGISEKSMDSLLSTADASSVAEKLDLSDETVRHLLDDWDEPESS